MSGRNRRAQAGAGFAALACAAVLAACGGGTPEEVSPSPGDTVDVSPSAEAAETTGGAPLSPVDRPEEEDGPASAEAQKLVDALDAAGLHARDATADARLGEAATLGGTELDPTECIAFADPGSPDAAAGAGPQAVAAAMGEPGATVTSATAMRFADEQTVRGWFDGLGGMAGDCASFSTQAGGHTGEATMAYSPADTEGADLSSVADIEGEAGGAEVTIRSAFAVSGEVLVTATTVTAGGFSSSADPVEEIVAKALAEIS